MIKTLIILSLCIFVMYTAIINMLFNELTSLSISTYKWKAKCGVCASIFTFFCWGTALSLLPAWLELTPTNFQVLPFIASASLIFVGASPMYIKVSTNSNLERNVHIASALLCIVSSYFWAIYLGSLVLALIASVITLVLALSRTKRAVYYIEVVAFLHLYVQLLNMTTI